MLLGIFVLLSPGQNPYILGLLEMKPAVVAAPIIVPPPAPYPENISGVPLQGVTAEGVVVLDVQSGVFLYKQNEEETLSPASTTKILTALVALDSFQLDDVVTVGEVMNVGQVMGLLQGEQITVENLLYGALIHSGNDAAWALASHYPGGIEKFVMAMNKKAASLHLNRSTFTNPAGFDDAQHKMTPLDLARLARIALGNSVISKMVAIPQITVSDVTHTYFHNLKNVNELLGKIPGVGGIKTGWTEDAGENLVTLVDRQGHKVIIVVLKSKDRFGDTVTIIDWIYSHYTWSIPVLPTQSTR